MFSKHNLFVAAALGVLATAACARETPPAAEDTNAPVMGNTTVMPATTPLPMDTMMGRDTMMGGMQDTTMMMNRDTMR